MVRLVPLLGLLGCAPKVPLSGPPTAPLDFPRDHGAHPEAQTEWWYVQATVRTEDDRHLALFLSTLRHDTRRDRFLGLPLFSVARQGLLAWACVTDLDAGERVSEKWNLGATAAPTDRIDATDHWFSVRLRRWRTWGGHGRFTWEAPTTLGRLRLHAVPTLPPMPIGNLPARPGEPATGRAAFRGAAFSYYTLPRTAMHGELGRGRKRVALSGDGWVDHQYGTIYSDLYNGWWWVALMLDDGTDLMLTRVDPRQEGVEPVVLGTIRRAGETTVLPDGALVWEGSWTSRRTGADYPTAVSVQVPSEGLDLRIVPRVQDVEWKVQPAPIWEGPVAITGTHHGVEVGGQGYLELLVDGDRFLRRFYGTTPPSE